MDISIYHGLTILFVVGSSLFFIFKRSRTSKVLECQLMKNDFTKLKLLRKLPVSHNTAIYRFILPSKENGLNLPIGQHISVKATIGGKEIIRSYTPISLSSDVGYFDLLVKSYENGLLSKHFSELIPGDYLEFRGPKGKFVYKPNMCTSIGMIAGGTGITPMLQIIQAVIQNVDDYTKISLIFANVNEKDILLRETLMALCAQFPDKFDIYFVLNSPPPGWEGGVGFVTQEMIKKRLPSPSSHVKILLCGPPPMIKAMENHCRELGYGPINAISKLEDMVFKF
jgi:cytochrome-b5 reductase